MRLHGTTRRLAPLFAAEFLSNFIFWYAVEKFFMRSIGFNDATIGLMVAAYSAIILICEVPSGILADRWSRKGVLILGYVALLISAVVCGLSNSETVFLIGTIFWGIFYALYSGTNEAIVYDTLLEEEGSGKRYELYFGRLELVASLGLIISSIAGGLLSQATDLRTTFFWSVPPIILGIIALLFLREPSLHRAEEAVDVRAHIIATFRAVLRRGALLPIVISLILVTITTELFFEMDQLWLIALAAPAALYGIINAIVLGSIGFGGVAAAWRKKGLLVAISTALIIISSVCLIFTRNLAVIVAAFFCLATALSALSVVYSKRLHDTLPSKLRAGATSTVSTTGRGLIIPIVLLFGAISNGASVFHAAYIVLALAVLILVFVVITMRRPHIAG
ncbi:MAG: major facilitator superfamily 1 [Candidatus Saccharibacteria bacterium]|nr:major facilitator superfamily 1 [Candidatus Saccharibacteria bacterium]